MDNDREREILEHRRRVLREVGEAASKDRLRRHLWAGAIALTIAVAAFVYLLVRI